MKKFNANKALRNDEKVYGVLEKTLNYIFYELLYRPIINMVNSEIGAEWSVLVAPEVVKAREKEKLDALREEIKKNREVIPEGMITNAKDKKSALVEAILKGKVQYNRGYFEGSFSADISREIRSMGGTWDKKGKRWRIPLDRVSYDAKIAIGQVTSKMNELHHRITTYLSNLKTLAENQPRFKLDKYFEDAINELENKFEEGVKGLVIPPTLTYEMKRNLAEQYTNNLNLYINNWTIDSIERLRKRVEKNAFEGYRSSALVEGLEHDYQMSHAKAKFLARQETSLLMSQFREERYKSVGVERYMWSTSGDQRVRPYHKRLNGKVFSWDNPPIVNERGDRKHPGQDFGCRCIAIPIID